MLTLLIIFLEWCLPDDFDAEGATQYFVRWELGAG